MKKNTIGTILLIAIIFLLTGCVSQELREQAKQYKKEGEVKLKAFLEDEFDTFTIDNVEQAIIGNTGTGYQVSAYTTCTVEINGQSYFFAYNRETDTYWSNYYYDEVIDGLEVKLAEYGILGNAESCSLEIGILVEDVDARLLLHEDKNVDDVLECKNTGEYDYSIWAYYYFSNESNFEPKQINLDSLFEEISDIYINLRNTDGKGKEKYNIKDEIVYNANDYDGKEVQVAYYHNKIVKVNGVYFLYNDNYYNVEVSETEYDIEDPNRTLYENKDLKYTEEAYLVKATRIGDKPIKNGTYDECYVNDNGTKIEYDERQTNVVFVYYETPEKYEGLYAYQSKMQEMLRITHNSYPTIELEEKGTTETVLAIYKEK